MFDIPWLLPVVLILIALGIFFLIVTNQDSAFNSVSEEKALQVQCPSCDRWEMMEPIHSQELIDQPDNLESNVLPGKHPRFLNEYKCKFCGHSWQERYAA